MYARLCAIFIIAGALPVIAESSEQEYLEFSPSKEALAFDAGAAFESLKAGLVGEWQGRIVHSNEPVEATFYLTGNDSAIVEYIRRPQKPAASMSSVYHLADEHLQVTHYCSMMNQPRLLASAASEDGINVGFELLDVTNLSHSGNRYTHKMRIELPAPDKASVTYVGVDDGVEGELTVELWRIEPNRGVKQ
jgi:hypothetical protein